MQSAQSFSSAEQARKSVQASLQSLSVREIELKSVKIIENLLASPDLNWEGKTVGLYRSLAREVQLALLEKKLPELGAKLCYPRIIDSQKSLMHFVRVEDPAR